MTRIGKTPQPPPTPTPTAIPTPTPVSVASAAEAVRECVATVKDLALAVAIEEAMKLVKGWTGNSPLVRLSDAIKRHREKV